MPRPPIDISDSSQTFDFNAFSEVAYQRHLFFIDGRACVVLVPEKEWPLEN
jgi:hypothetical protein